jgi:5'-nucleotidase
MYKKLFVGILLFSLIVSGYSFAQEDMTLTIVHMNDIHARVESSSSEIGLAAITAQIKTLKVQNPNTLVLDAGDAIHGLSIATLTKGESVIEIYNDMGIDAMAAGNHDFDYGQDRLVELKNLANFPILSANVLKEDNTKLMMDYVIKEVNGVKVGIFGLTTPETTFKTHPDNIVGLKFQDPIAVAKYMVAVLDDKTDMIIALAHLGLDASTEITSEVLAMQVDGIDLIVDGHSHTLLTEGKVVNDTTIVQTGEYGKNLGIVDIDFVGNQIESITPRLMTKAEFSTITPDQGILDKITEIKAGLEDVTSAIVGDTSVLLEGTRAKVRTGETNLGNAIANSMLEATGANIAFTNGGGIRASIDVGEITRGEVLTVLPFGNIIVTKEILGSDLKAALELGLDSYPAEKGAFPHIAGMKVSFDDTKPAGSRVVSVVIDGVALDLDKTYIMATNDFLAAGGDGYTMFTYGEKVGEYMTLDEALVNYVKANDMASVNVDGRITVGNVELESTPGTPDEQTNDTGSDYTVVAGDTLWEIGKFYDIPYMDIVKLNNLSNPNLILVGQKLLIPEK